MLKIKWGRDIYIHTHTHVESRNIGGFFASDSMPVYDYNV